MSTIETLEAHIDRTRLKVGNEIVQSTGAVVTASTPVYVDSASKLATGSFPFALPVSVGATIPALDVTGTGTTGVLTQTFVGSASVTTATIAGYIRVSLTNGGSGLTSGSYYLPIYTLL